MGLVAKLFAVVLSRQLHRKIETARGQFVQLPLNLRDGAQAQARRGFLQSGYQWW